MEHTSPPLPAGGRWIRFDWNREPEPGVVHVLAGPHTPDRTELWERLNRDEMTQPFIFETGRERCLHFTWRWTQSIVDCDCPQALVAPYSRKMLSFLLLNPVPQRILMLGLGGGELARFCHDRLPRTDLTAVEINADVIALRDAFFIPRDDERFRVVQADGADYLAGLAQPVDALLVDAFDRHGIAPTLARAEFYRYAADCLTDNGLMVMNFCGEARRYVDNLKLAAKVFGRNLRLVSSPDGNLLLFAAHRPLPRDVSTPLWQLAQRLKQTLQLDFPHYLQRLLQGNSLT